MALLIGASALEAKRGGKGKGKAKGQPKVSYRHKPDAARNGKVITVGAPAGKAHDKHGDAQCPPLVDACLAYDNGAPCTVTGGVATCPTKAANNGAECVDPVTGGAGTCANGICEPSV